MRLAFFCRVRRPVKNACRVGPSAVMTPFPGRFRAARQPARAPQGRLTGTSYSEIGITGITPILGLFRSSLLCTRDGPVTWDDALSWLSPVGIIRCHSLSPHRRWMMSSRSCHSGVGRGLWVVALFAFSSAWRFISESEEHTSELQSLTNLVCRLLLEKKKNKNTRSTSPRL